MENVELQDEDSFEVISVYGSKYSVLSECEENLSIMSISNAMSKSFPEIDLCSDLMQSTSSDTTLTLLSDLPLLEEMTASEKIDSHDCARDEEKVVEGQPTLSNSQLQSVFQERQHKSPSLQFESISHSETEESKDESSVRSNMGVKPFLSVTDLPKVKNSAIGIWGWLCPNSMLHAIVDKAWASIDALITTLDPQMAKGCSDIKPEVEILFLTPSDFELGPLQKAFKKIFHSKIAINHRSVTLGCIPMQPVGFESGIYCTESRIKFIREHKLVPSNKVIVATSPVLVEITSQRWHHTTCIMLDDPRLSLNLHLFTDTVPVPNIYANQAKLRTPVDYPLKHLGFNISVGKVICIMTGIPENDWQYVMTGTSLSRILESGAGILAGMYKCYLNGVPC